MRFIDELYNFYKDRLTADDEDVDLLVSAVLQELSREDLLQILSELSDQELYQITGTYVAGKLRQKLIQDREFGGENDGDTFIH